MRVERHRSATLPTTRKEPLQRVSSQSVTRVQPKNPLGWHSVFALLIFCLSLSCSEDPFRDLNGEWRVDIPRMQASLTKASHATSQAKAAARLSRALLERYRFRFQTGHLAYGNGQTMRGMDLEYLRTEKKTRLVFRSSDSPFLLRVTPKAGNLILDFEDKVWHLSRRE